MALVLALCLGWSGPCRAADDVSQEELQQLKERIAAMEAQLGAPKAEAKKASKDYVKVGGAVRFNYRYDDDSRYHQASKDRGGDMKFDLFRLDVNGSYKGVLVSAQYRFMEGMNFIHHGWVGYNFTDDLQVQLGLTQVPFGILPYASHNWWFGIPFYLGFEDDYDMGVKLVEHQGPWDLQVAFFKNGDLGNASDPERYSYDLVTQGDQQNEETNQVNARLAYTLKHGDLGSTELGLSGQWGQLYNNTTKEKGSQWAAAAHLNGYYGPFNLMLEAIRYALDPKNPVGVSDKTVLVGAYNYANEIAAKGTVFVANLSYDVPVAWGPVSKLTFYDDYSRLVKDEKSFQDSEINTLGCMITAGPVYTYVDLIMGRNAAFIGAGGVDGFAGGQHRDDGWNNKVNINVGYYF